MRIKIFFSFFILLFFLAACTPEKALSQDTSFKQLSGETISLKALQGKWIIINFWADWCEPCAREIPQLNAFYKKHRKQVMVYGYHFDHPENDALKKMIRTMNIHYPALIEDPSPSLGIQSVFAVPTTCFISPQGVLKKCIAGEQTKKSLEEWLD